MTYETIESMPLAKGKQELKVQIRELCTLGNRAGLHDAVNFLQTFLRKENEIKKLAKKREMINGRKKM